MKSAWSTPATVSMDELAYGSALSIESQPALGDMYEHLSNSAEPLTLVVGAGFSVDAGLATWKALIERLVTKLAPVDGVDLAALARSDSDDLMRKAESIIAMRLRQDKISRTEDLIHGALYEGTTGRDPGPLLRALVDLVRKRTTHVSILTTNFDELIEIAFKNGRIPYSQYQFRDWEQWESLEAESRLAGKVPVMHLHGRLGTKRRGDDSVILTESHFLKHGPAAREIVAHALRSGTTVFLGVSLTDPNLIGPLWDTRDQRRPTYAITTLERIDGFTRAQSWTYALEKSSYLSRKLRVAPIFLKTYSQIGQVLHEVDVYSAAPRDYTTAESKVAYVSRLNKISLKFHTAVGCTENEGSSLTVASADALREKLHSYLDEAGTVGAVLHNIQRDRGHRSRLRAKSVEFEHGDNTPEKFGLELWLRKPASDDDDLENYAISLIGSSHFSVSAESSTYFKNYTVGNNSKHMAARSIARGKVGVWDVLPEVSFGGVWKSVVAVPLRLTEEIKVGSHELRVPITVGALCLTSTHHIHQKAGTGPCANGSLSMLSAGVMKPIRRNELYIAIHEIGSALYKLKSR